jgi:hypothetical protein
VYVPLGVLWAIILTSPNPHAPLLLWCNGAWQLIGAKYKRLFSDQARIRSFLEEFMRETDSFYKGDKALSEQSRSLQMERYKLVCQPQKLHAGHETMVMLQTLHCLTESRPTHHYHCTTN